jgi:hypothetical protein
MTCATAGCDRAAAVPTAPEPTSAAQRSLTVEPASARPEFVQSDGCFTRPGFAIRIWLGLQGGFAIHGVRFHFIDRFGTRSLPTVIPFPSPSATPSIPSASPVPVPGIAALPPLPTGGTSPFIVNFGCGVVPDGTLFIYADHDSGTAALRVRISH